MSLLLLLLLIILVYWLVSLLLLCFPNIVWTRHRRPYQPFNSLIESDRIFCIGHRGGSQEAPQNTMECFQLTQKACDMFQLDVVETRDKHLVVHHDLTLERTCGVNRPVAQLSYEDLPCFKDEISMHFSTGKVKTTKNKIILLRDLFQRFPDKPMNIELKSPTTTAIQEINRLVSEFDRENITVWGIVRGDHQALKTLNPNVQYFFQASSILKVYALYIFGLLPFCCLDPGMFEIPLFTAEAFKWFRTIRGDGCLFCVAKCIIGLFNCITGPLVRHLKKRGIPTFCFILNCEDDYQYALGKGVCGIMTDRPTHLKQYLQQKGLSY